MSNVSVLDEFLLTPWIMKLKNLQHSTCAMLTYLNATVPSKFKSSHSTSMNALLGSTNFWASGYAKWPVYHFWLSFSEYLDISTPTGPKASSNQKVARLNGCKASNVHDRLAIPEKNSANPQSFHQRYDQVMLGSQDMIHNIIHNMAKTQIIGNNTNPAARSLGIIQFLFRTFHANLPNVPTLGCTVGGVPWSNVTYLDSPSNIMGKSFTTHHLTTLSSMYIYFVCDAITSFRASCYGCEILGRGQELILLDQACFWPWHSWWHRYSHDTTDVWQNIWVRSAWSLHGVFQHANLHFWGVNVR